MADAPTTPTAPVTEPVTPTEPVEPPVAGPAAEIDWQASSRKQERENKKLRDQLAAAQAQGQTDAEKAIETARKEGETTATKAANARILRSEVKSLAVGKLADPSDALPLLRDRLGDDLDGLVDDKGDVDEKAVKAEIDALIKEKPHLAASGQQIPGVPLGQHGQAGAPDDMNALLRRTAGRG